MTGPVFEFVNVSKKYGETQALSDVSFALAAGRHTAILGPSGCGKSTLLRLLAGLELPSRGEVLRDGQAISTAERLCMPPHQRGVAMVFQDLALWPNLSVRENVRLGLAGAGLTRDKAAERVAEALRLCAIEPLAGRLPGQLSGGQQQRAALARALAVEPAFLLLDEPFSGIDLVVKVRLLAEISKIAARTGLTIVLVSHDPQDAAALCQSAIVLERGRVEELGELAALLQNPRSAMLRAIRDYGRPVTASPHGQ